jgi:lipoate-protein ligase A
VRQIVDPAAATMGSGLCGPATWLIVEAGGVEDQLAIDEALLEEAHEGRLATPVARTWMAAKPAVVVGSSSRIDDEVDRAACVRLGVPIMRRPSGGLTVVLGPGCVMWSVVVPLLGPQPPIEQIHAGLLSPLCQAIRAAGRPVIRRGSSDLAIELPEGERKVSGNALRIRRGGILYHGTLLDMFDLELVGMLLRHPPREPDYRAKRTHADFLANLNLGRAAIDAAVRMAFSAERTSTSWPMARAMALAVERYASTAWTERTA